MKEVTGNGELLSRVQDLESKLEDSEQEQVALWNKLEICQKEEGRACQKILSLKKETLFMRSSQVRTLEGLRHQANHRECYIDSLCMDHSIA